MLRKLLSVFFSIAQTGGPWFYWDGTRSRSGSLLLTRLPSVLGVAFFSAAIVQLSAQNAATSVSVDASANQRAINPNVYGVCYAGQSDVAALNPPLNRAGGNEMSEYNWQIDALNKGSDWYWESYLQSSPQTAGGSLDTFIQDTHSANVGSEPMITIPMQSYIATLGPNPNPNSASIWSYSVKKYGTQEYDSSDNLNGNDPYQADAGSGLSAATGKYIVNNPLDAYVPNSVSIQQAWVQHLTGKWGLSTTPTGVKYYILDNEPSLWNSTHRDIHPSPETYEEEYNDIVAYATAIRAADPNAKIVAPEEWVWWAMYESGLDQKNGTGTGSDYATHNNTYYYPWLLQQLSAYQQKNGTKLIDVLSVHCYNQIPGGIDDSASGQATRNRYTRILWDPNYADPSWEGTLGINGGVENWIPQMKNWVNQYYPGLDIGCTEYNWGDETALNGATTQADVEGIYGVYGFDLATRWTVPANPSPTYLAMEMYRNYDGKLSTFGDTSVSATVANPDNLSAFAAVRSSDGALTVMVINKQQGSTPVTVSLANFSTTGTAQAYQISSATQTSINSLGSVPVASNAISTTVPSQSITLFVIPAGSVTTAPTAPTGLAATVGNGTVTLTWNAGGGATSYTVSRGSASGGPFTAIGTVTSPSPTTFTNTGLTNGTTYYYVVSGTNSIGTGPNSAPVAATPIVPPTFAVSASALPNPVTQNASTTVSATVQCTANSLTNGTVQMIILDPNGNVALTQNFTAQSFTTNQSQTYTASLTPTLAGTYTVEVGVFSATGQQWSLNTSAGTITVNSALAFTASATASPTSITTSGSSTISVSVKDTGTIGLTNGIVQLLVIDPSGNQIVQQNWTGENITAGGTLPLTYTFTPSSLSPPATTTGAYTVDIGVFNSTWSTDYYWNGGAATITVTAGTTTPSAPTGLTATPANGSVALSWTASTGATSYNVYRGTTSGGESTTPIASGIATTSYSDPSVTNGSKYYYKVAAVNTAGTGALSAEASATPEPAIPSAPAGLTATAGSASVSLSWTASTGATSYNVYRGTAAGGENTTPIASGITATSYSDTSVTNGTKYFYKVAAVNTAGTSTLSAEASATPEPAIPSAPIGLAATASNASVSLSWTASSDATSYNVYRGTAAGGESTTPIASGITAVSYTDTSVTNGTKYFYKVAAVNSGGTSALSAEASATPEPGVPSAPTGLVATVNNASVSLSWTASSGATSYNVYRGTTSGGESTTPIANAITAASYSDITVTNGTTYFYRVAAVNAGGTSALSAEASATPEPGIPSAPASLAATASNASVSLSWTASTGATSYNVYRGTAAGGESTTPIASGITATSYSDTSATNGTTYFYKVAAVNAGGTSALSAEASATPESGTSTPFTPTVTVTPASATPDSGSRLSVTASVAGAGGTPTGTVTLSGGGYTSMAETLANGSYAFSIPANSLSPGTDALTVSYSGDANYAGDTGTASVTVMASAFSLVASAPAPVAPGLPATSTVTVSTATAYSGTVALACALTSSPAGATDLPTCSSGSSLMTLGGGTTTGMATVTVNSTPASIATARPGADGKGSGWAGGAVLAFLVFLGIPARRRSWRLMLSVLVLMAALGSLTACSSALHFSGTSQQVTTAGNYTFTVTGTGSPLVSPAPTTTFTLTIN